MNENYHDYNNTRNNLKFIKNDLKFLILALNKWTEKQFDNAQLNTTKDMVYEIRNIIY